MIQEYIRVVREKMNPIWDALPDGPWKNEPGMDWVEESEYRGLKTILKRSLATGSWCGYVEIPLDNSFARGEGYEDLDVHGGITYSEQSCPINNAINPTGFWLGFDCGHAEDANPLLFLVQENFYKNRDRYVVEAFNKMRLDIANFFDSIGEYRTLEYARNELHKLIDQIKENR